MKILIPLIKCQGIKSKLVGWIAETIQWNDEGGWIEPFMGSEVVGFTLSIMSVPRNPIENRCWKPWSLTLSQHQDREKLRGNLTITKQMLYS